MITLSSIFRDSADYLPRYFAQIEALRDRMDVRLVLAEGDSTDDTFKLLDKELRKDDALIKVDHGGPKYGSIDRAERWADIARVVRATVEEVGDPGEAFIWVESDLMWEPSVMLDLIDDLADVDAVAPKCMAGHSGRFYDYWGFRKNGEYFMPYHPWWHPYEEGRFQKIDSCGSCFATNDWPTVRAWDGIWPYRADGKLWLDATLEVRHP